MAAALLAAGVGLCSCRQQDLRTFKIRVPEMHNAACAEVVGRALARVNGVQQESIRIDVGDRSVTLTYDSMVLSLKNIEYAIAQAGFTANDIPADAEARAALPPECRR